jgi:hypothetical protein
MSDEVLNIRVTETELDLIMELLHEAGLDRVDANGQPAIELCHDLMEQSGVSVDDLDAADLVDGLTGRTFEIAEDHFIDAGMQAREQAKASSRAAQRRNFNLKGPDRKLSKTQTHDVWDANDPKNW